MRKDNSDLLPKSDLKMPDRVCPYTGLPLHPWSEQVRFDASRAYRPEFSIVGDRILLCRPSGTVTLFDMKASLLENDRVAAEICHGEGRYVQIEDFSRLQKVSQNARRCYIEYLTKNNRLLGLIFCNVSTLLKVSIEMGKRFNRSLRPVIIANDVPNALAAALTLLAENGIQPGNSAFDCGKRQYQWRGGNRDLHHISHPMWHLELDGYENRFEVIDGTILHSASSGFLQEKHLPHIDRGREAICNQISPDRGFEGIVVNVHHLKGGSRRARKLYMRSLRRWHDQKPFRFYILYGTNNFMRTAALLANPFMPFRVEIVQDLDAAVSMLRSPEAEKESARSPLPAVPAGMSASQKVLMQPIVDRLMAYIGSIDWEQRGVANPPDLKDDNPFQPVFESIRIIKSELDELNREREAVEREKENLLQELQQARKMEAMGTLAGGIAHDFNNILGIIIGNAELAMDDLPEGSPAQNSLNEIQTAGFRARDVVRELLRFSHREARNRLPLHPGSMVREAMETLRGSLSAGIEIRYSFGTGVPAVLANPEQIRQVLINLFRNAAAAMEGMGGLLTVEVGNFTLRSGDRIPAWAMAPGNWVRISVKDTGSGIPEEILDRIFDPYFTTREVGKGSGLGLSVVHGIITGHGGTITAESEVGKGSLFTVFLPAVVTRPVLKTEAGALAFGGNEHILMIDDELSLARTVERNLAKLGYQVEVSTDPRKAWDLFRADPNRFDLVISDLTMPGLNGDELIQKMLGIRPGLAAILCTGYSETVDARHAEKIGIRFYLMKPVGRHELAQVVRAALDGHHMPPLHNGSTGLPS